MKILVMFVGFLLAVSACLYFPNKMLQGAIDKQIPSDEWTKAPLNIKEKIFLYERYGGEWQTSNKEPIVFTSDEAVLRNKFAEEKVYRFTPMIYNKNEGETISDPEIYINLPAELKIMNPRLWRLTDDVDGLQYHAGLPESNIPPFSMLGINESLFIVFPKPGRYEASYSIKGTTKKGVGVSVDNRKFYFDLTR
ncbi:MAG: hypothetical protein HYZ88_02705 [Candidatus Omnitrophica bacterium]|nr:hypothetical protein [Candidatus Omnitrophota bacterium]